MRESFLIAEGYAQLLCEFAAHMVPGYVPVITGANGPDGDPLRLRSVSDLASTIEQLMAIQTEIPIEWQIGEYWTEHGSDLATSRAMYSANVREVLEVLFQNQLLLTNVRTIAHSDHGGDVIVRYYNESRTDPIVRFIFNAMAATKLWHFFMHYLPGEELLKLEKRADSFGSLLVRFGRQFEFFKPGTDGDQFTLIFAKEILEGEVADTNRRLIRAIDRELSRRSSDIAATGRWKDRIKYHMQSSALIDISLDEVCDLFGVPRRTLSRQLQNEGTSFSGILRELRRDRALYLVRYTRVPLKRIASELGFNSDARFNQAFKSWTGITPMKFRKSQPPE